MLRLVLVAVVGICFLGCAEWKKQAVLAKIEENTITVGDFQKRLEGYNLDFVSLAKPQVAEIKQKILNEIIDEKVMLMEAQNRNLTISNETLEEILAQMRGGYSESEFENVLKTQGQSYKEFKLRAKTNYLIDKVIDSIVGRKEDFPKEKIETYYKEHIEDFFQAAQYNIQQIIVADKVKAEEVYKELKKGSSFEVLAKVHSISPEAHTGGYVGWISSNAPEAILSAVAKLPLKGMSAPVTTDYGVHIVKVLEKKPQRLMSLAEATPKIVEVLGVEAKEEALLKWKQTQFSKIKIVRNNALLKSL